MGGGIDERKSISGYCFMLANSTICWQSKKQSVVALSTTEAEYIALTEAAKEAIHLRFFINELGLHDLVEHSTVIFNDNQSAHYLVKNEGNHNRTKHIAIRYHFIRSVVKSGDIKVCYKPTDMMLADVLTKGLYGTKHQKCLDGLRILKT